MINLELLNLSISELQKKGKNKIEDYEIFTKLKLLHKNHKTQTLALEQLRAQHNIDSSKMAKYIKQKTDPSKIEELKTKIKNNKVQINTLEEQVKKISQELRSELLYIPNFPDESVPFGNTECEDVLVRKRGDIPNTGGKDHVTLGRNLKIIDWERTAQIAGARFVSYINKGARLKRALMNFMLDHNTKVGYTEMSTPYLLNKQALEGTGQLPKFAEDLYITDDRSLYLIPTSEVSLTNFYKNTIFKNTELPIKLTQYSQCFRKEAGAAGKDNRGIIRLHQFDKVELVQLVKPESSIQALNEMVETAAHILEKLDLPYRIIELCTSSLGFSSKKTFDIEVWMPAQKKYREISSCSNCGDFQARRINLKYNNNKKNIFLHTLNGSSLAIDRLMAAFIENHQTPEGFIKIPAALQPYMQGIQILKC